MIVRCFRGLNDVGWNVNVPSGGRCHSPLNHADAGDGLVEEGAAEC